MSTLMPSIDVLALCQGPDDLLESRQPSYLRLLGSIQRVDGGVAPPVLGD